MPDDLNKPISGKDVRQARVKHGKRANRTTVSVCRKDLLNNPVLSRKGILKTNINLNSPLLVAARRKFRFRAFVIRGLFLFRYVRVEGYSLILVKKVTA